jgi:preprotein translocase subunit SecG
MNAVLIALHVIVCFFLVAVVLLQRGKGAEMGAVFGGGASSTVFGGRGAGNFLTKLTTGSAIIFMCTSLTLSYFATKQSAERLFEDGVEAEAAAPPDEGGLFEDLGTVAPEPAAPAPSEAGAAEAPAAAAGEADAPEPAPSQTAPEGAAP